MATRSQGGLLKVTRGLIILLLAVIGLATALALFIAVALPFAWPELSDEIMKELPRANLDGMVGAVYALLAFGLVTMALAWAMLQKLLKIIHTVAEGDPFIQANALRLKSIGWLMTAGYVVGIPLVIAARAVADKLGDNNVNSDLSITGILAILLVFVLAGVFEQGAKMREEMEATV